MKTKTTNPWGDANPCVVGIHRLCGRSGGTPDFFWGELCKPVGLEEPV